MEKDPKDRQRLSAEFLGDRRKSLEDAFFAKQNERLASDLREKAASGERKDALSRVSGIKNDDVLEHLVRHDIEPSTVAALALVPLVVVAWADGNVDDKERAAVIAGAEASGIAVGSPSRALLEGWLDKPPEARLLAVWKEYVGALSETLEPSERQALRQDILGRAREVAESAGGFLGLGSKVSDVERAALDDLEAAFG